MISAIPLGLRIGLLVGDDNMESLSEELTLENPDLMIATPDNLICHLSHVKDMLLHNVECIVLYEADCLLSLGFAKHLREILTHINQNHQTLLSFNTRHNDLVDFVKSVAQNPRIEHHSQIPSTLKLIFFTLCEEEKSAALLYLINERIRCGEKTLLFVPTEVHAEFLKLLFMDQGMDPSICYRNMGTHECRLQVSRFKAGKTVLLITTDIAYEMMQIPPVDNIINWDFPCSPERFLSRVRTTVRAGQSGTSFSFVTHEDIPYVLNFRIFLVEELMAAPTEEQIMRDSDRVEVVSGTDQANAGEEEILYGSLPPIKDCYADMVRHLLDSSPELKAMERFCAEVVELQIKYKREYGVKYF